MRLVNIRFKIYVKVIIYMFWFFCPDRTRKLSLLAHIEWWIWSRSRGGE